jgi:hypothetical protein
MVDNPVSSADFLDIELPWKRAFFGIEAVRFRLSDLNLFSKFRPFRPQRESERGHIAFFVM